MLMTHVLFHDDDDDDDDIQNACADAPSYSLILSLHNWGCTVTTHTSNVSTIQWHTHTSLPPLSFMPFATKTLPGP